MLVTIIFNVPRNDALAAVEPASADGTRVWTRDTGVVEQRAAVDGHRVFVPAADGRLVALRLDNGEPLWEYNAGISEMRIHVGPGYRLYYCRRGEITYLLLCAGDKSSQQKDIRTAKALIKSLEAL